MPSGEVRTPAIVDAILTSGMSSHRFMSNVYRFRVLVQAKLFSYPRSKQQRVQWIFSAFTPLMILRLFQAGRGGSRSQTNFGRARRGEIVRCTLISSYVHSDSYFSYRLYSTGIINDRAVGYDPSSRLILSPTTRKNRIGFSLITHFYRRRIRPHPLSLRPWERLLRPVYLFVRRLRASETDAWYVKRFSNHEFSLIHVGFFCF